MNISPPIHFDVVDCGVKVSINLGKKAAPVATQVMVKGQLADVINSNLPVWTTEQIAQLTAFGQAKMNELYALYVEPVLHNPSAVPTALRIAINKCDREIAAYCAKMGTDSAMLDLENQDAAAAANVLAEAPAKIVNVDPEPEPQIDYLAILNKEWDATPIDRFEGSLGYYYVSSGCDGLRLNMGVDVKEGLVSNVTDSIITADVELFDTLLSFNAIIPQARIEITIENCSTGRDYGFVIEDCDGVMQLVSNEVGAVLTADESGLTFKLSSEHFEDVEGIYLIGATLSGSDAVVTEVMMEFQNASRDLNAESSDDTDGAANDESNEADASNE